VLATKEGSTDRSTGITLHRARYTPSEMPHVTSLESTSFCGETGRGGEGRTGRQGERGGGDQETRR
jgi:hypothetical protein